MPFCLENLIPFLERDGILRTLKLSYLGLLRKAVYMLARVAITIMAPGK